MTQTGPPGRGGRFAANEEPAPRPKYWWAFPAAAGAITLIWIVLSLPRAEDDQGEPGEDMPYTTKRAGFPLSFARWSVAADTGNTTYSTFSGGNLLVDLLLLAAPIVAAWFVTRQLRPPQDKAETKSRGGRSKPPPRGSPGPAIMPRGSPPPRGSGGRS